jgi:hypothetical protein
MRSLRTRNIPPQTSLHADELRGGVKSRGYRIWFTNTGPLRQAQWCREPTAVLGLAPTAREWRPSRPEDNERCMFHIHFLGCDAIIDPRLPACPGCGRCPVCGDRRVDVKSPRECGVPFCEFVPAALPPAEGWQRLRRRTGRRAPSRRALKSKVPRRVCPSLCAIGGSWAT